MLIFGASYIRDLTVLFWHIAWRIVQWTSVSWGKNINEILIAVARKCFRKCCLQKIGHCAPGPNVLPAGVLCRHTLVPHSVQFVLVWLLRLAQYTFPHGDVYTHIWFSWFRNNFINFLVIWYGVVTKLKKTIKIVKRHLLCETILEFIDKWEAVWTNHV